MRRSPALSAGQPPLSANVPTMADCAAYPPRCPRCAAPRQRSSAKSRNRDTTCGPLATRTYRPKCQNRPISHSTPPAIGPLSGSPLLVLLFHSPLEEVDDAHRFGRSRKPSDRYLEKLIFRDGGGTSRTHTQTLFALSGFWPGLRHGVGYQTQRAAITLADSQEPCSAGVILRPDRTLPASGLGLRPKHPRDG